MNLIYVADYCSTLDLRGQKLIAEVKAIARCFASLRLIVYFIFSFFAKFKIKQRTVVLEAFCPLDILESPIVGSQAVY